MADDLLARSKAASEPQPAETGRFSRRVMFKGAAGAGAGIAAAVSLLGSGASAQPVNRLRLLKLNDAARVLIGRDLAVGVGAQNGHGFIFELLRVGGAIRDRAR